jgi:hypothetical protein
MGCQWKPVSAELLANLDGVEGFAKTRPKNGLLIEHISARLDRRTGSMIVFAAKARDVALASTAKMVLMKRHAPVEAPIRDDSNFTHLHRACLLWVYYLRADSEAKKQAFLYEAAKHLMLLQPCGDEGELV